MRIIQKLNKIINKFGAPGWGSYIHANRNMEIWSNLVLKLN